jgi:hypothetical protein
MNRTRRRLRRPLRPPLRPLASRQQRSPSVEGKSIKREGNICRQPTAPTGLYTPRTMNAVPQRKSQGIHRLRHYLEGDGENKNGARHLLRRTQRQAMQPLTSRNSPIHVS